MTDLDRDDDLHRFGEQIPVPLPLIHACAWWVVAELIRRHPHRLAVIETHPGGGMYDCLTVIGLEHGDPDLTMTLGPMGRLHTHGEFEEWPNWADVLLAPDRRALLLRLEASLGLTGPARTPATTAASIGPRLIANFFWRAATSRRRWLALNGVDDTAGYGGGPRDHLFDRIPGLADARRRAQPSRRLHDSAYRYWFVGRTLPPEALDRTVDTAFVVDTWSGDLWRPDDTHVSLLDAYGQMDRSLDRLVDEVCPPIH